MRGGRADPDFDLDEDLSSSDEEPAPKPSRSRKQQAAKPKRAPKRPAGLVNLRSLIEEGLLTAAEDVLTVEYKGTITHASLTPDGRIRWKDMFFESPSAFSIYLKRLVNPTRKADDGWKTVKYAGKFLEQYKMELLMRRYGGDDSAGTTGSAMDAGSSGGGLPPSKRPRTSAASPAAAAAALAAAAPPAPALRQLAPRGRGAAGSSSGKPPAGPGAAGTAAAAAGDSAGAAGFAGKSENTPRPPDLGSMVPAEHDFAPREGELAGMGEADELPPEPGRHFISGVELEAMNNGTVTPSSTTDAAYTPPRLAAAAATAAEQQQQQQEAAAGTATPSGPAGRPRRVIRAPERLINSAIGAGDRDDHDMVRCEAYSSAPAGSGQPGAQPFRVQVAPLVEVMMDFHAHLDRHEVIGLLAGSWDAANRLIRVERAFPVREAIHSGAANDGINVEMDPEDQFKVTEVISELYNMQVVGWYHSHPSFPALPSVIDIDNQLQMQQQVRQAGSSDEPYIAAIVSPYSKRLPGFQSSVTWFRVEGGGKQGANAVEQGYLPMELSIERLLRRSTPDGLLKLIPALRTTALRYTNKRSAANLTTQWQPPTAVAAAAAAAAAAEGESAVLGTRLAKLLGSIRAWWPSSCSAEGCKRFMDLLKVMLVEAGMGGGVTAAKQQQQQMKSQRQDEAARSSSAPAAAEQPANHVATTSLARALAAGGKPSGGAAAVGQGRIQKVRIRGRTPPSAAAAVAAGAAAAAAASGQTTEAAAGPSGVMPPPAEQQQREVPLPSIAQPQQQQQQQQQMPKQQEQQQQEQQGHSVEQQEQQQQQQQAASDQVALLQQQQHLQQPRLAVPAEQTEPADADELEATDTETEDEADVAAAAEAAAAAVSQPGSADAADLMQGLSQQHVDPAAPSPAAAAADAADDDDCQAGLQVNGEAEDVLKGRNDALTARSNDATTESV